MENVGLYVASKPLSLETSYFEIQILNPGSITAIGIGLVPSTYPMNAMPGWRELSVGYHADDGWSVFLLYNAAVNYFKNSYNKSKIYSSNNVYPGVVKDLQKYDEIKSISMMSSSKR